MIDYDTVDRIGDVLERVGHPLEVPEHLAGDGELQRVGPSALERALEAGGVDVVRLAFELG